MGWWWDAHLSTFPRHLTKIKVLLKNKWGGRACISERLVYFYKSGQTSRIYCDRSKTWGESRDSPWRVLKIKKIKKWKFAQLQGCFFIFFETRAEGISSVAQFKVQRHHGGCSGCTLNPYTQHYVLSDMKSILKLIWPKIRTICRIFCVKCGLWVYFFFLNNFLSFHIVFYNNE